MEYTKSEIVTIGIATLEAKYYADTAHELLLDFIDTFFSKNTLDDLVETAKNNPGRLVATVAAIREFLYKARAELDAFASKEASPALSHLLWDAQEKQKMLDAYHSA